MKTNKINPSRNKTLLCAVLALVSVLFVTAQAQFQTRNIQLAQARIRERIIREQGGRNAEVRFNDNGNFEAISNRETRVSGAGTYFRDRNDQGREFTYESIFYTRNGQLRSLNYDFRGDGNLNSGNGNWNGNNGNRNSGEQTIYCASDNGRRNNCPANTRGGVRLVRQQSGSACIEGSTWGYDRNSIWVDRGCSAEFEVGRNASGNRGISSGGIGNGIGGDRPNGRVLYRGSIINRGSNKGLDVTERGREDGANIQQWDYANQPNQNWDVIDLGNDEVAIVSQHSGRVLTVQGGRDNNGANIIQRTWRGAAQQRWRLQNLGGGWVQISNTDNGKCLDVEAKGRQNGANIQQWDCASQANQQWRLGSPGAGGEDNAGSERPNGQVRYTGSIINRESNKGLDVSDQSRQDGANIQQWDYAGQANQNWDVIDLGNGEVAIISQHSGHALTVRGGNDRNAANLIQRRWRNTPQQRWRLEDVGGGWFKVRNVDTNKCLDVTDHSKQNGANIQQWDCADQANQHWRLGR